ncbi:putative trehalose synthase protein [Oceaniovalibus guishaninsula JLT2003]|uniref:Putative trehalose synthase protein n=1 Tax=Oceaniovalibus guishaninsula JLT2003 TaxID=1231392 RepID=K2GKQ5_9RHOB|nr:alpha-amylase family protein [Oceaniovalibus guishaninsula]EKE43361.1 putative trehalose synthase protein [Oceaniovalibus guishaninsula JLT2003]
MLDLWYKNAVIYCLDVETFMDGDGDGTGDFRGLTDRLAYLEGLGVTTLWLNPFYPSPNRDNGYDITDFYNVDPAFGSLGHFVEFSRAARDHGMKVMVDLVCNHTSVDHPWFQSARDPDSPYRDWYVWSRDKPDDIAKGIIFPGVQEAVWTHDDKAGAWYMHRFYSHQADLNIANPLVREEILRIMGCWLELGVEGFRIDAVPFLIEYEGLDEEPDRDPLLLLSEMRDFLAWRKAGAIMLAEANVPRDSVDDYFGGRAFHADERMHMLFDFPLNQRMWLAFVRGDAEPIREALRTRPPCAGLQAQWAVFLRNHDELSLDKLSDAEREEVFAALAPDESMRIYGRGIRRRLAPMLGHDRARLDLAHSLLFALPGTPVMWYGDEIGMGENADLNERNPVRTPMQWSDGENGGFSSASRLARSIATEPGGPQTANVADQRGDPHSLVSLVQRLVRERRSAVEIGWGGAEILDAGDSAVLALLSQWKAGRVLTLHNLSAERREVRLDPQLLTGARVLVAASGGSEAPDRHLDPYGWRWIRLADA